MLRCLNHLDRNVVSDVEGQVRWQWHLRQAECPVVGDVVGADDLEGWHHNVRHVWWRDLARSVDADVDVEECVVVALEPAWLDGEGTAFDWPECSVCAHGHSAAWVGPLHSVDITSQYAIRDFAWYTD